MTNVQMTLDEINALALSALTAAGATQEQAQPLAAAVVAAEADGIASHGLAYVPTADSRFRRTERLRLEVPLAAEGFTGTGKLLTREGQATPLVVTVTGRTDDATKQQFSVADVSLAPLAAGEYVLELSLTKGGKTDVVSYGFRIVP